MMSPESLEDVQVELRARTSMSPDFSASKRPLAESGENLTLLASLKIAAATARHTSTSNPVQLPLSSGLEKPGSPWLTPQTSEPRSFTFLSVAWAELASTDRQSPTRAPSIAILNFVNSRFMIPPLVNLNVIRQRSLVRQPLY